MESRSAAVVFLLTRNNDTNNFLILKSEVSGDIGLLAKGKHAVSVARINKLIPLLNIFNVHYIRY